MMNFYYIIRLSLYPLRGPGSLPHQIFTRFPNYIGSLSLLEKVTSHTRPQVISPTMFISLTIWVFSLLNVGSFTLLE